MYFNDEFNDLTDDYDAAYKEALATGEKVVHRARLNFYGYLKAGKSSLFRRLLGKQFDKDIQRTEGIDIQAVKVKGGAWKKFCLKSAELERDFNKVVEEQPIKRYVLKLEEGNRKEEVKEEAQTKQISEDAEQAKGMFFMRKEDDSRTDFKKDIPLENRQSKDGNVSHKSGNEVQKDQSKIGRKDNVEVSEKKEEKEDEEDEGDLIFAWDFGGQAEYYATHHLFLDAEAAHLIVMDVTKNFHEPVDYSYTYMIKSTPATPKEFLCYWLNSIHSMSFRKGIQPSIAIFLTHTDEVDKQSHKMYVGKYKKSILKCLKKTPYKEYISEKNIYDTDNTCTDEVQFLTIRQDIHKMITKQNSWGEKRPAKWVKLEADIRRKKETESAKYLNISEVQDMAQKYEITKDEVEYFMKFHNTLGEFVHFPDKGLKHLIVIDTQWLVDKFKALISPLVFLEKDWLDEKIVQQLAKGQISEKDLNKVWKDEKDVPFLIELMKKLHLLIPFREPCDKNETPDESSESSDESSGDTKEPNETQFLVSSILPYIEKLKYEKKRFKKQKLVKVYTAIHKSSGLLPIGTFHTFISKCSNFEDWTVCPIDRLTSTGVYFDIERDFTYRLSIILLSYIESTIETSMWLKRGAVNRGTMCKDVVDNILDIMRLVDEQLKAVDLVPATEFRLLCPNWNCKSDDECFVTLTRDPGTNCIKFCSHEGKCKETKVHWDLSTYKGTKFGELSMHVKPNISLIFGYKF